MQDFMKMPNLSCQKAHLSFEEVLEKVKGASQVTFVGEVAPFVEQIQEHLPRTNYKETLPNASQILLFWLGTRKQTPCMTLCRITSNVLRLRKLAQEPHRVW